MDEQPRRGTLGKERGQQVLGKPLAPDGDGAVRGDAEELAVEPLGVDDAGPALPSSARRSLLSLELDPGTYGRPSAVPLYVASEIAVWQGGLLELGDAPIVGGTGGGLRVTVTFPL